MYAPVEVSPTQRRLGIRSLGLLFFLFCGLSRPAQAAVRLWGPNSAHQVTNDLLQQRSQFGHKNSSRYRCNLSPKASEERRSFRTPHWAPAPVAQQALLAPDFGRQDLKQKLLLQRAQALGGPQARHFGVARRSFEPLESSQGILWSIRPPPTQSLS